MGAFCVYGVSLSGCLKVAEKKVSSWDHKEKAPLPLSVWVERRDSFAADLFEAAASIKQISPEFDAPEFCFDWLRVAGNKNVKLAKVMVRGPKVDKNGNPVKKNGAQVMTWLPYSRQPVIEEAAI